MAFSRKFLVHCWTFLIYIRLSLLMGLFTRQSPSAICANVVKYSKANSDNYALANQFLFFENINYIQTYPNYFPLNSL